ncbi:MAG: HD-GYP domain-containing protein (c-di-GMP phosphodiesterase class II) [Lentisphaeria bacterium]|jgi:HD-GYP domain-containing protein (c-di-GMP phosphodiesterase class II)
MTTKKPLREITVADLKVGMHLVKLDISWLDSPFFSRGRKIKSLKDVDMLQRAGAHKVSIDPNKGLDLDLVKKSCEEALDRETLNRGALTDADLQQEQLEKDDNTFSPHLDAVNGRETSSRARVSLEKELAAALNIRSKVKKTISKLHETLSAEGKIHAQELTPLLDQTLESLERNNQALLNLAHINQRSQKIADHSFSTFCIALNLAQQQKLAAYEMEALGIAALLHEAGWAHIPLHLMGKRTSYTPMEIALVAQHTELALKSLKKSDIPELSLRIIAEHHELSDGSGYPKKLSAEQIHPLSQLFTVVDRYDELVHQLNDKPGMLPTNALRSLYLSSERGLFNCHYAASLIALLGIYPVSSAVKLSSGAKGIVREVITDNHLYPVVEVFYDAQGKEIAEPYFFDLGDQKNSLNPTTIESVVDPQNAADDPGRHLELTL